MFKKPFLEKGNEEERLSYAKIHKNWTETQWQQVIFQQVNDPKHTANALKAYMDRKPYNWRLSGMGWPPWIQDLNIIEAVYDHLDRKWNKR